MPGDRAIQLVIRLSLFLRAIINIEENLAWTERALVRAETQEWRSQGLTRLAEFLRLAGRLPEAHVQLERAERVGGVTERGAIQAVRAAILHTEGRHAESLVYYLRAAEALDKNTPERSCILRSEAALQTLRQGDAEAAVQLGRQAIATARRTGDAKLLSRCEGRLGLVLARLGRHWEALPRLEASATIPRETGDDQALAFSLFHLAEARTDAGELHAALAALQEGADVADRLHIPVLQAMYRSGLGVVHLLSDRPEAARSLLEDAIRLHHDAEQPARTHYALGWLAVCHADLKTAHLALPTLEQCQRVASESGRSQAATALWTALTHLLLYDDKVQAHAAIDHAVTDPERAVDLDLRILETYLRQRLSRCCNSVTT
jgi:tetratricopeptide (TPR) repeat protein